MNQQNESKNFSQKISIIEISTMTYGIMAAVGIAFCLWGQNNFFQLLQIPAQPSEQINFLYITLLASGVLLIGSFLFQSWSKGFQEVRESMMVLIGDLSTTKSLYLALISAIGEEFLFRGAILPSAGLYGTSILFGLLHIGPKGSLSTWSLWAVLSGLILGQIVISTKSILPAIAVHFIVNSIAILLIRRDWISAEPSKQLALKKQLEELEADQL